LVFLKKSKKIVERKIKNKNTNHKNLPEVIAWRGYISQITEERSFFI
jgi:hypothetical protein